MDTFLTFSPLSHNFSAFSTSSQTFLTLGRLSHTFSAFRTLPHTFSTFSTLSQLPQLLAHFLTLLQHFAFVLNLSHIFIFCHTFATHKLISPHFYNMNPSFSIYSTFQRSLFLEIRTLVT